MKAGAKGAGADLEVTMEDPPHAFLRSKAGAGGYDADRQG
jgi:hypothetical protein